MKTMMQDFFEKHPNAPRSKTGEPKVCPDKTGYCDDMPCMADGKMECLACWSRPKEYDGTACIRWVRTADRLPVADEEYFDRNGEHKQYLVKIDVGVEATVLYWDGTSWLDENENAYNVTHWAELPDVPEEE